MNDRSVELSRLARTALIMIDGVKSVEAITKVLPGGVLAAQAALDELLAAAFVEVVPSESNLERLPNPNPKPSTSTPSSQSSRPGDFQTIRQDAARRLAHMLGPFGDDAAMAIERSKDAAALRVALEQAARAVHNFKGRAAAEEFLAQTRDLLD